MHVSNSDRFLHAVDKCRGEVFLEIPGHDDVNLKTDSTPRDFADIMQPRSRMEIRLTEGSDLISLISYAAESRCVKTA